MIVKRPNEPRAAYLMRVAVEFIKTNNLDGYVIDYDGTTCDGACLADELATAAEEADHNPNSLLDQ